MDDENNTINKGLAELQGPDLPWYQDIYNWATQPTSKEELIGTTKGALKQVGSFYNDLIGLGYNATDLGGIIPGETGIEKFFLGEEGAKDDPNFGLIDFVRNMTLQQKNEGELVVPLNQIDENTEFRNYMDKLNRSVIAEKEADIQKRFSEIIKQTGVDVDSIPADIRRNAFTDEKGVWNFFQAIHDAGGEPLDVNASSELNELMNSLMLKQNDYGQFYRNNSIMKVDWSLNTDGSVDRENSMVIFGDMPKVDHGFFGMDMTLDPGYTDEGDLSLTNLGKYRMVDGELTRVQPSVQNWLSDWNENPDRMSGILQSLPGYEAVGDFLDDKWVKNVAWTGHDFDFPKGVESQEEKEGFLTMMYPLMAAGAYAPASKLATSKTGRIALPLGGSEIAASLPNIYEKPE